MIKINLDRYNMHRMIDLSISNAQEEARRKIRFSSVVIYNCLKPELITLVAPLSAAGENDASKNNKINMYFKDKSDVFICSALMWLTLSHHTSRRRKLKLPI